MKKEKIALIGYGYWGKKLYGYLQESPQFDLVYVHFRSLKKLSLEKIHADYGKEFVPDIETIWENKEVAHVVISTPVNTHFALAQEALLHKKNILVEKPLTLTEEEACSLRSIAKKEGLCIMTEYVFTFSKALEKAREIVLSGQLGAVKSIQIFLKQLGRFLDYDVFVVLGSHALSMLDLFVPLHQCRFSAQALMDTKDIVTAGIISFSSQEEDLVGTIDVSLHCPQRDKRMIIYGEKGTLVYDLFAEKTLSYTLYKTGDSDNLRDLIEKEESFSFDESHNLRYALENFYDVVKGKKESNLESAIAVTSVLESLNII